MFFWACIPGAPFLLPTPLSHTGERKRVYVYVYLFQHTELDFFGYS